MNAIRGQIWSSAISLLYHDVEVAYVCHGIGLGFKLSIQYCDSDDTNYTDLN